MWCEVASIAYSPVSAKFVIILTHLETRDVGCLVCPSCAFCSSHLDNALSYSRNLGSPKWGNETLLWEIPFPRILLKPYWITPAKLANGVQACEIWAGFPLYIRQCLYIIHSESLTEATWHSKILSSVTRQKEQCLVPSFQGIEVTFPPCHSDGAWLD